jgi:hypothetical protein
MTSPSDILPIGKLPGDLLARLIAGHRIDDPAVVVGPGIGRDAAAIEIGDTVLVVKTDPITFATDAAAQYLVDVNANDLACMGATPRWLLVTALLPEGRTTESLVESLFRDLQASSLSANSLVSRRKRACFLREAPDREIACSSPNPSPSKEPPSWRVSVRQN